VADFEFDLQELIDAGLVTVVDGVFVLNEQHVAEAIDHLIELFKYGPRNQAIVAALVGQFQELENAAYQLKQAFDLDTAIGLQLDILGEVLGEDRKGRDDDDYRAALRVVILVSKSHGTIPQLLSIAQGMSPSASVNITEPGTMTLQINLSTLGSATLRTVFDMLKRAKAGGVRLLVTYGGVIGAVDGTPAGGIIGAADGSPAGFTIGGGT
jgi:hypothetical protein